MKYAVLKQSCDDEYSQVYEIYSTRAEATKKEKELKNGYDEETSIWVEKTNCKNINEYIEYSM